MIRSIVRDAFFLLRKATQYESIGEVENPIYTAGMAVYLEEMGGQR